MTQFQLIHAAPSPESYQDLRRACGLPQVSELDAIRALAGSSFWASAYNDQHLVGFGRIVSDHALSFSVQDVMLRKGYKQHKAQLMGALQSYLDDKASAGAQIAWLRRDAILPWPNVTPPRLAAG